MVQPEEPTDASPEREDASQKDAPEPTVAEPSATERAPDPANPGRRSLLRTVALVVFAFVLLWFTRREIIEGYQIPTHSMEPTFRGDPDGDKVIVYKKPFLFREPKRWEIAVFRRQGEPGAFVKRIAGLPGEQLWIGEGDVYINGEIERKPDEVQADLLIPVYVEGLERQPFQRSWAPGRERGFGWNDRDGSMVVETSDTMEFQYRREVRDGFVGDDGAWNAGRNAVGDLRLELELTPTSDSGAVVVLLRRDGSWFEVLVPFGSGSPEIRMPGSRADLSNVEPLERGRRVRLTVTHIDLRLTVAVDGRKLHSYDYSSLVPLEDSGRGRNEAAFGIVAGSARFHDLSLYRDLYYTASGECGVTRQAIIPGGSDASSRRYFLLGDNSGNSRDSRFWGDSLQATVPFSDFIGVPVAVFWPPRRARFVP